MKEIIYKRFEKLIKGEGQTVPRIIIQFAVDDHWDKLKKLLLIMFFLGFGVCGALTSIINYIGL